MSNKEFAVTCQVCFGEVNQFVQSVKFIMTENEAVQQDEVISLSCGCSVDFPDWRIDINTGMCQIYNFAEILYIEFFDKEMIVEDDWQ